MANRDPCFISEIFADYYHCMGKCVVPLNGQKRSICYLKHIYESFEYIYYDSSCDVHIKTQCTPHAKRNLAHKVFFPCAFRKRPKLDSIVFFFFFIICTYILSLLWSILFALAIYWHYRDLDSHIELFSLTVFPEKVIFMLQLSY